MPSDLKDYVFAKTAPIDLRDLPRPRAVVRKQFVGEFLNAQGDYVGDLHQISDPDDYRIVRVEYGKVLAESRSIFRHEIVRAGSSALSASRKVNHYKLKEPG